MREGKKGRRLCRPARRGGRLAPVPVRVGEVVRWCVRVGGGCVRGGGRCGRRGEWSEAPRGEGGRGGREGGGRRGGPAARPLPRPPAGGEGE